ncbi:hypothetical protein AALB39_11095 [Lachnospiraceae bacterium 54-53]
METFGSWESTLYKRGFEQAVLSFLEAVRTEDAGALRQAGVLASHEICDRMVKDCKADRH